MSTQRDAKIFNEEALERLVKVEKKDEGPKRSWINKMMQSARLHYKKCPYYDHKTKMCFIALGEKCNRDGRFDGCQVFIEFIEAKYDDYVKRNAPLPVDFLDLV